MHTRKKQNSAHFYIHTSFQMLLLNIPYLTLLI